MKRFIGIVPLLALVFFAAAPQVLACPWYDPLCATPTSTPTATPTPTSPLKQLANPNLIKNIQLVGTNTPTATPTVSPTPTFTPTPTITVTETPSVSLTTTPVASPSLTATGTMAPTPTTVQPKTLVAGFTNKELAYAGVVVVLVLFIIFQANWEKIKTWLHNKTS